MHNAIAALKIPFPRTKAITTDSKITGIEKIVSIKREKNLSINPPKYPLSNPNGNPIPMAKNIAKKTIWMAIVEPCNVLKQTSLPNLSVPQKWENDGAA